MCRSREPVRNAIGSPGLFQQPLSFSVRRSVDVERWATAGEKLLDLRHTGKFQGRGSVAERAERGLASAWRTGDAAAVTAAMASFRDDNQDELLEAARVPKGNPVDYRAWLKRFAQWLYRGAFAGGGGILR
jgi:hypothetical protein